MLKILVAEISLYIDEVVLYKEDSYRFKIKAPVEMFLGEFKKIFYSSGTDYFTISNTWNGSLNHLGDNSIFSVL